MQYHNDVISDEQAHLFQDSDIQEWEEGYAYDLDTHVMYEGIEYIAIRWTIGELPSLCESSAWKACQNEDNIIECASLYPDTQTYFGSGMEEDGFTFMKNLDDVDTVLQSFSFKKIKAFNVSQDKITSRLLLPSIGDENTKLEWESNAPDLINSRGEVTRTEKDMPVWLKLTVTKGSVSKSKVFELWVKAKERALDLNEDESVEMAMKEFDLKKVLGNNRDFMHIREDLEFMKEGPYGTSLSWLCMKQNYIDAQGKLNLDGLKEDMKFKVYVLFSKGKVLQHKRFFIKLCVS